MFVFYWGYRGWCGGLLLWGGFIVIVKRISIGFEICLVFVIVKRIKIMIMGYKFVYVFLCWVFCVVRWCLMFMMIRMWLVLFRYWVELVKGFFWKLFIKVIWYFIISIFWIIIVKILICFNYLLELKVF